MLFEGGNGKGLAVTDWQKWHEEVTASIAVSLSSRKKFREKSYFICSFNRRSNVKGCEEAIKNCSGNNNMLSCRLKWNSIANE